MEEPPLNLPPKKLKNKAVLVVVVAFGGLCILTVIAGTLMIKRLPQMVAQPAIAVLEEKKKEPDKPLEYQLAVINAGGYVPESHITVKRFRYLLNELQKKTGYTQQQIADANVYAVNTLRDKYGKNVQLLDFMEQTIRPLGVAKVDYKEVVAAMIVLIGTGNK